MSAVWDIDLHASQKIVLLALADCANDEGHAWPGMTTLARKCSKSERTVQTMLAELEAAGHITRNQIAGKGCNYTIHPRKICTPAKSAPPQVSRKPPQKLHPTPAKSAPNPSLNLQEPSDLETNVSCPSDDGPDLKPDHVVEEWNKAASKLGKPKVLKLTPERRALLKSRIAQYDIDDFLTVLGKIERSAFLRGDTGWRGCNFDWIFKKANFQKILEGNYDQ